MSYVSKTYLRDSDTINFKGFDLYSKTSVSPVDGRPIGGSCILIKKGTPHEVVQLNTDLQATAVQVTLHRTITICSLYIPPRTNLHSTAIDDLLNQLPSPRMLLGDFNAHSILWGNKSNNSLGDKIEKFIEDHDLCLLNDKSFTYLHPATGSLSAVDLSICSPNLLMDFSWEVHNDQCGSDHFPIFITINQSLPKDKVPNWNLRKANWTEFASLCHEQITGEKFENADDVILLFSQLLIDIANKAIPKTSTDPKCIPKPWFNTDCDKAIKCRIYALVKEMSLQQ